MSKIIKLNDILNFSKEQVKKAKVKFNTYNGYHDPIELYKTNPDKINKEWLYWRANQRYFRVGQIAICLVRISHDNWLLTTIDTVESDLNVQNGINNTGIPFTNYEPYFGRIVIKYHKEKRSSCMNYLAVMEELEVLQILSDKYDDDNFHGYDNISLQFEKLQSIIERGKKDWIAALESQKGVYLISDTKTGKMYVGSATGDNGMLLQRWKNYISNGHGGNKELKRLVEKEGLEYVKKYFKFSLLENYNSKTENYVILERESWWKKILMSKEFGYNRN